ncbi:MAG: transcription elongation factor GreA [Candidatus Omnitrophica bacterium]|nr:transcription elongation factor GreA [Candidatus Omnitrophota bacterium]
MKEVYLTRKGYEKLLKELQYLKTVKRKEIVKALQEARAHGDISENAEYDSAKEAQAQNERNIIELEDKLSNVRIIDEENIPDDIVLIGATVRLKNLDKEEEVEYTLVSELEADYKEGKIAINSAVGKGLLGRREGEVVEIKIPAGILRYKILRIARD